MRSPIKWFGGKGLMTAKLLPFVPEHRNYCEVFGGGASLLFAKRPSNVEVYNDINSGLVNFFRVLRDETKFIRFHRLVQLTPYSREEYNYCRHSWINEKDDVKRAHQWFVVARQSFNGEHGHSWGIETVQSRNGMIASCSKYLSIIELLPELHRRIMSVQIENSEFYKVLKTYDSVDTFFYLDPPYVLSRRKSGGYQRELWDEEHELLVDMLLNIQGKAMLSGYQNKIYERLEKSGWHRESWKVICAGASRASDSERVENIWMNYTRTEKVA